MEMMGSLVSIVELPSISVSQPVSGLHNAYILGCASDFIQPGTHDATTDWTPLSPVACTAPSCAASAPQLQESGACGW